MGADPSPPPQIEIESRPSIAGSSALLNGIIWVLRIGAPWRDILERYGKWTIIYSHFQRWHKSGVWNKMFSELQTALEQEKNVN
jgi:transposase